MVKQESHTVSYPFIYLFIPTPRTEVSGVIYVCVLLLFYRLTDPLPQVLKSRPYPGHLVSPISG